MSNKLVFLTTIRQEGPGGITVWCICPSFNSQ